MPSAKANPHRLPALKLASRNARASLLSDPEPYWTPLDRALALGYYKPKQGPGTWRARLYLPDTKALRRETIGVADDIQDADGLGILDYTTANERARIWAKRAQETTRMEAGGEIMPKGPFTVNAALDAYFADAERRGVKGLGRDIARSKIWIRPELGPLEVAKLTRKRIESWHQKMAEAPRKVRQAAPKGDAPMPRKFKEARATKSAAAEAPAPPATDDEKRARKDTANRVLTILKAALNHALDRRTVVASGEAWREAKPYKGTTKARVRFLSVEDQVRLVNASPEDFRRLVKGALHTGGRYGELARVTVQDFDPTGGTLFLIGKGTGEGKPRRVVLTEEGQAFFEELTAGRAAGERIFQRDQVERRKLKDAGLCWAHGDQSRFMADTCKAAGLDPLGFHELRHSYASLLVNAGCPLVYVAAQLGHTDTRMVEKHYGHLAPNALADSIRTLMPKLGLGGAAKVKPLKLG